LTLIAIPMIRGIAQGVAQDEQRQQEVVHNQTQGEASP
jgi:hypothetical protein